MEISLVFALFVGIAFLLWDIMYGVGYFTDQKNKDKLIIVVVFLGTIGFFAIVRNIESILAFFRSF